MYCTIQSYVELVLILRKLVNRVLQNMHHWINNINMMTACYTHTLHSHNCVSLSYFCWLTILWQSFVMDMMFITFLLPKIVSKKISINHRTLSKNFTLYLTWRLVYIIVRIAYCMARVLLLSALGLT